jgi:hypothetical protein
MIAQHAKLPSLPPIGQVESYYKNLAHDADKTGDLHAHEAAKVGQYITLALDPALPWDQKLKYFGHALRRHCRPPMFPDDDTASFYKALAYLVRQYAGQEALRLASAEDDMYAARLDMGAPREEIESEAEEFFRRFMGEADHCPDWFNEEDWSQLKLIRDQWI